MLLFAYQPWWFALKELMMSFRQQISPVRNLN